MARFYASMKGQRGEASRMGSAASGIHAHVRGWDVGIEVFGDTGDGADTDTFTVYLTAGSNGRLLPKLIGKFTRADLDRSNLVTPRARGASVVLTDVSDAELGRRYHKETRLSSQVRVGAKERIETEASDAARERIASTFTPDQD